MYTRSLILPEEFYIEGLEYPPELIDHLKILLNSAKSGKYEPNNWLQPDGKGCGHKSMYASIHRHVSFASVGVKLDKDSGMDHRLHAAIRLMMDYTRYRKGIKHPED